MHREQPAPGGAAAYSIKRPNFGEPLERAETNLMGPQRVHGVPRPVQQVPSGRLGNAARGNPATHGKALVRLALLLPLERRAPHRRREHPLHEHRATPRADVEPG